jgi:hypothetical protein
MEQPHLQKLAEPRDLHVDAVLTNFSQQYKNEDYICESVLPQVKVKKRSDVWFKYDKDQRFTLPEMKIDPKGKVGEADLKVSTDNYSVKDYGLEEFVSQAEMDNADNPLDPQRDAVDLIMGLLMLAREKRCADLVFAAGSYGSQTSVPANKWTHLTNGTPLTDAMSALDIPFLRPNIAVFGADSWRAFRSHPQIVDAVKGATRLQGAKGGIASREDVAALFELDAVYVGRSRYNTAKLGQTASYTRLWVDNAAFLRIEKSLSPRSVSFGCSLSEMEPTAMVRRDDARGIKGGISVRVAHNMDEKIKAADLGYLYTDTNA